MKYLMLTDWLTDGKYKTTPLKHWHERWRIKLAKWLFNSVKKTETLEIKTTTGAS